MGRFTNMLEEASKKVMVSLEGAELVGKYLGGNQEIFFLDRNNKEISF